MGNRRCLGSGVRDGAAVRRDSKAHTGVVGRAGQSISQPGQKCPSPGRRPGWTLGPDPGSSARLAHEVWHGLCWWCVAGGRGRGSEPGSSASLDNRPCWAVGLEPVPPARKDSGARVGAAGQAGRRSVARCDVWLELGSSAKLDSGARAGVVGRACRRDVAVERVELGSSANLGSGVRAGVAGKAGPSAKLGNGDRSEVATKLGAGARAGGVGQSGHSTKLGSKDRAVTVNQIEQRGLSRRRRPKSTTWLKPGRSKEGTSTKLERRQGGARSMGRAGRRRIMSAS